MIPENKKISQGRTVSVIRHVRDGEVGRAATFRFPNNSIIFEILMDAYPKEKEYSFHLFDSTLVSNNYSAEVDQFLVDQAKKTGYTLSIKNRVAAQGSKAGVAAKGSKAGLLSKGRK